MTDITQLDLYELFGVNEKCTNKELTTAFRKKALTCHPDKYPDDNDKTELFLQIKKALELLTDKSAREAYDVCRQQKKRQQERISQMDGQRKKFKDSLDEKERQAAKATTSTINKSNTDKLRAEVERLRREGSRLVDNELEELHNLFKNDRQKSQLNSVHLFVKYIPNTEPYTNDQLRLVFNKYGNIAAIVNTNSSALIEFDDGHISAVIKNEKGLDGKPFASVKIKKQAGSQATQKQTDFVDLTKPVFEDYEAEMLRKMAQAINS